MKRRTEPALLEDLPDGAARRAIREDLSTTILVEAAAGTGKTQSLVDRMVALVSTGETTVDRLSAVTFTIRAAAQLKQRFQAALEEALRAGKSEDVSERLSAALARLDSCFVGTIHAFGARLLRERPVEAGVDPGFTEMDDPEDGVARRAEWDRFTEHLFITADPRLGRLIELGVSLSDLPDSFRTICDNSDVAVEGGGRVPEPDFTAARAEVAAFLTRAMAAVPAQAPAGGWSEFESALRRAERLTPLLERPADFVKVLKALRAQGVKDSAPPLLKKTFERLREDVIKPAITAWEESIYPDIIAVLVEGRERYREWRRREGRLNFQDLLLGARDLLRDHPEVRSSLCRRFTPVLVDEFQDTDPIQAEILFYLTGSDTEEKDWKRLVPRPGSLFMVGDPKQSIYRFRRADIQTYDAVRSRIEACGRVLRLSTNFRSTPALCAWVNHVFSRSSFFPAEGTEEQAAYVPLDTTSREDPSIPSVFCLEAPSGRGGDEPAVETDAARIAGYIAASIAKGERRPEDFLLLFRRRKFMADYARELERRGVAPALGGGKAFGASEELAALMPALEALADPDNPVPLLAAFRGPLFGVDDEALYRFAKAGGRFSFRGRLPAATDPRIARAVSLFREGEELARSLPPGAAISRFVEKLGWIAAAAARDLGDSRAGNLLKALAAARKFSAEGLDFQGVVEELSRLRAEDLIEEMGIEPGRPGAVRLMTIHGAKGLEAPVVFLADPSGGNPPQRDYFIERRSEVPLGYFRIVKKSERLIGGIEIARPAGWDEMQAKEKLFDSAEKVRLLYVGATRARQMLVVSVRRGAKSVMGPWRALHPFLDRSLPVLAAPSAEEIASEPRLPAELEAARRRRAEARPRSEAPGFAVASVTALAHAGQERPFREETGRGLSWGSVIHRLLEAVMRDPSVDVRACAANVLAEEGREPADLDEVARTVEAVRSSPLWKRALAAKRRLVEVPFALMVPSRDLSIEDGPAETLLAGALDLVFEEDDGWTIVDYKSDTIANNLDELVAFYKPQIAHYRRYWQSLTGRPTKAGLYFVATGREVWLD
ncbi:MAG TPA: UvrD-helicase domain-containing protein [Thermoanaerobaculia bacterium]|nr:UvrD-helicase domain-containing protein [Thermoanaerobaculia bacterium]